MASSVDISAENKLLTIGFGDTVLLPHETIGTVRFIGYTEFKKNIIFYGIHLKEAIGKNNGSFNKRKYFKCTKSHGIFTERKNIVDIVKKHSISASFHYGQTVQIINSHNSHTIGKGSLCYIGLMHFDNYKNYFYGVKLNTNIKQEYMEEITNNQHIQTIVDKQKNIYFDADPKRSIFVRQNQLRCIASKNATKKRPKKAPKVIRSQSMLPQKKAKLKSRAKTIKASKKAKKEAKKSNKLDIPDLETDTNTKQSKISSKKKKKIKEIRSKRMAKSDLGQIAKHAKKTKKEKNINNIDISESKENWSEFNGCSTPNTKKTKKKNKNKAKKPKEKENENVNPKSNTTKDKEKKKPKKRKKKKEIRRRSHSTITVHDKYKGRKSPKVQIKKRNKKNKKRKTDKGRVETIDGNTDTIKYNEVVNDAGKYCKYVDDKNWYYHQQFAKQYGQEGQDVVLNRIRARSLQKPPPTMGSYFSARSRTNMKKKRALPLPPQVYSVTIDARPMGFFIETKKLYTITENKENEQIIEQVEVADRENKFNKMNAYISMIQSEEWKDVLMIGSQLLSINEESITGLSFSKIFQKLSSHPLPFTLTLATPNQETESPRISPKDGDDDDDDYNGNTVRMKRMQRGQTFDETTKAKSVRSQKKWRFFQLF